MTGQPYGKRFYDNLAQLSRDSARIFLGHLFSFWKPASVIDVGCGDGAWLGACTLNGPARLVGLDGNWVTHDMMPSAAIEFRPTDLRQDFSAGSFDLAISMEVAEHLPPEASDRFFHSLARCADAVLFSAAFSGQPGTDHINTRLHSFWAAKFLGQGYQLFDLFRPKFWSDERVAPWYRQNTFLYAKPGHPLHRALEAAGLRGSTDAGFVDCIHPWLYFYLLEQLREAAEAARPA